MPSLIFSKMASYDIELKNLTTDGYLVIRQFLSSSEIREYSSMYRVVASQKEGGFVFKKNNPEALLGLPCFSISHKIDDVVDLINRNTNFNLNYRRQTAAFFDTTITSLLWHQDDDTDHHPGILCDSVNFWMPIIKPEPTKSGISIVPPLVLKQNYPSVYKRIIGRGDLAFFVRENGKTDVLNRISHEHIFTLDCNIETMAYSPTLFPGDLFLFRGDIPHRTQDHDTSRVAIGIRCSHVKS